VTTIASSLVKRIIEDLRAEADRYNARSMVEGYPVELKRQYRIMHEKLRQLANTYEQWEEANDPA